MAADGEADGRIHTPGSATPTPRRGEGGGVRQALRPLLLGVGQTPPLRAAQSPFLLLWQNHLRNGGLVLQGLNRVILDEARIQQTHIRNI
jgi:hypothetical protein